MASRLDRAVTAVRECEGAIEKKKLERAQMEGSLCTVEGRVSDTKKQLNDPKYRKVDDNHRKKLIECKTTQVDPTAPWARATTTPAAYLP